MDTRGGCNCFSIAHRLENEKNQKIKRTDDTLSIIYFAAYNKFKKKKNYVVNKVEILKI